MAVILLQLVTIFLYIANHEVQGQLSVSSLPDVIFDGMNPAKSMVEGSVVWLYCEVNSTSSSLSVTWNKDGGAVVADVPHIILRTSISSSSTTLLLVLDNVVSSDAGQYQCTAEDGQDTASGTTLTVTTVQASMTGVLEISSSSTTPGLVLNRAAVTSGDIIMFPYTASYVGGSSGLTPPSAMWLRDGSPTRITSTDVPNDPSNGQLSSTLSFTFQSSDAGVYTCIFTSGTNVAQIYGINPLRLDTGSFTVPERVSPPVIFLTPPEKLVLEYSTSGGYSGIILSRNQQSFGSSLFQVDPDKELTLFGEIFVRSPTTATDLGVYDLDYAGTLVEGTIIIVTSPASPNISLSNGQNMMETIMEGENLEISCTSTGGPLPTITWTIDNQPTTFNRSDIVTNTTNNINTIIPGNVVSKLQIVDAQYPTHDGEYTCTGSNSFNGMNNSNSATITVVVQAVPEVQLTTDQSRVSPGSTVTLTCMASMGNPTNSTFSWSFNGNALSGFLSFPNSSQYIINSVKESEVGNYSCTADNGVGSDVATISISLGVVPMVMTQVVFPDGSVVVSGSTVQITCMATAGDLPITFTWSDPNGGTVMATSSNSTASTISITPTMSSDYGTYICNGSNTFGSGSDGFTITQAVAPMVSTQLGSPEVQAGANLLLTVNITAFNLPLTNIVWMHNGNTITDGQDRIMITNLSLSDSAPVMASLQRTSVIPFDAGIYAVTASNPAGNNTFTFNVLITDPATITDPSNDVSLEADFGGNTALNCTARGVPAPSISWQPTPKVIPISSTIIDSQGFSITTSSLSIISVQRTDTMYSCTANNTGQSQTRVFNITVNFAPENPINPVSTVQILSPESLSLNCTFEGFPVPSVSWIRNRDGLDTVFDMTTTVEGGAMLTISSSSTTNAVTSILSISPARATDTASYSCNATNRLGSLTSAVSMVDVYESPTIVSPMNGQQFTVNEGSDMNFTCMATGSPSPSISFMYENQILNRTDGQPTSSGGSLVDRVILGNESSVLNTSTGLYMITRTLTLFDSVDGDSGNFMCSASADIPGTGLRSATTSFSLFVHLAPSVELAAGQIAAPELEAGNDLTLSVNITRFTLPLTNITWSHAGNILKSGMNRVTITNSPSVLTSPPVISTLQRTSLIPNDFGMYVVTATNEVGSMDFTFDVEVPGSAVITDPSVDATEEADEGNTVVLSCTARGIPRPNITWSPGPDSSRSVTTFESTDAQGFEVVTSNITITNIQRSDTLYVCNASNTGGSQMRSFTITVNFLPGILTSPTNMQVLSPSQLSINCSADGLPLASIVWIRTLSNNISTTFNTSGMFEDGRDFTITSTPSTNSVVNVFSITSTLATDTANYTCRASNRLGTANSDTSVVSVYVAPNISVPMESQQFTVNEQADITFNCTASGSPTPSISFIYEGQELTRTDERPASFGGPLLDRVMLGSEVQSVDTATTLNEVTRTLTLFNATDQDSVNFVCSASANIPVTGIRFHNVTFSLLVFLSPAIMLGSGQVASPTESAGNNFNLVVSIGRFNSPLTSVMWLHNNSILMNMADRVTITNPSLSDSAPVNATLQRTSLIPLDAGDYVAMATNMVGSDTLTLTVTVTAISELTDPSNDVSVERDQGDSLTLSCTARGYPRPTITWSRTGMITTSTSTDSEGYLIITSNLTIASVIRDDSGVYTCTANNTEGMDAHSFNLTVYFPPVITSSPVSSVDLLRPAKLTLICSVDALPLPMIVWVRVLNDGTSGTFNTSSVLNRGRNILLTNSISSATSATSTFSVEETTAIDSGNYSCIATNRLNSSMSQNSLVSVYEAPVVISPMDSDLFITNEQTNISFTCIASGSPPPSITFMYDGMNLSSAAMLMLNGGTLMQRVTVGNEQSSFNVSTGLYEVSLVLTLFNAVDEDSRNFLCSATADIPETGLRSDSTMFNLTVYVGPNITSPPVNQIIVDPNAANFNCVAEGLPRPDIAWFRMQDGMVTEINSSDTDYTISTVNGTGDRQVMSTFQVNKVRPSLAATYVCNASNVVRDATAAAFLTVHTVPRIISPEEVFQVVLNQFQMAVFTCSAIGIPAPQFTWLRIIDNENETLTDTPPFMISVSEPETYQLDGNRGSVLYINSTLMIEQALDGDTGSYFCIANSTAGSDSQEVQLVVQVAPNITVAPEDTIAVVPNSANFTCSTTGFPRPNITWFFQQESMPMQILQSNMDFTVAISDGDDDRELTSTLTVRSVRPSLAGTYICSASNVVREDSESATLTIQSIPDIISPMDGTVVTVNQFEPAVFQCSAIGLPSPEFMWMRTRGSQNETLSISSTIAISNPVQDEFQLSDDRGVVSRVNSTLTINAALDEDSGSYFCVATNTPGSDVQEITLLVLVAPNITSPPNNATIVESEMASFTCVAEGLPRPAIMWFFRSEDTISEVVNNDNFNISTRNGTGERQVMSTLTITSVRPALAGSYICNASNVVNDDTEDATLVVHTVPVIISPVNGTMIIVNQFQQAVFQCSGVGIPPPQFTWMRARGSLNETLSNSSAFSISDPMQDSFMLPANRGSVFRVSSTLTINNALDGDSGDYFCVASNLRGNDSQRIELIVQVAPDITSPPSDSTEVDPNAASFTCIAEGFPRPSISWFFQENDIAMDISGDMDFNVSAMNGNGDRQISSTLTVISVRPSLAGTYICNASNVVDDDTEQATLIVHTLPSIVFPDGGLMVKVNQYDVAELECSAVGIPRPEISWFVLRQNQNNSLNTGGSIIINDPISSDNYPLSSGRGLVLAVNSTLVINETVDSDSGTYFCVATSTTGTDSEDIALEIQVAANITEYPSSQVVTSPNMATFNCTAEGLPRPNITWTDPDGRSLISGMNNINITTVKSGERSLMSTLQVMGTSAAVSGTYFCSADNGVVGRGDVTSVNANLTVYVVPNITSYLPEGSSRYVVNDTFDITFQCTATGVPPPDIQWFRGSEMLNSSSPRVTVGNAAVETPNRDLATVTREITITSISIDDADTDYRCEATNDAMGGVDLEIFELYVQVPPTVVSLSQNQREVGVSSGNVTLSFVITNAVPEVQTTDIRWYYAANAAGNIENINLEEFEDITELMKRTTVSLLMFSPDRLNLTISNIVQAIGNVTETDQGRYFLSATNPAGERFNYIDVVVRGPPQIVAGPVAQFEINNGSDAVFQCGALAIPQHNVTWFFTDASGAKMEIISTANRNTTKYLILADEADEDRFGQLTVANVVYGDRGTYMCVAANEFGTHSAEANLTVQVIPTLVGNMITSPRDTLLNASVAIFCQANGFPVPSISWQKDGVEIDNSDARVMIFTFQPVLVNNNGDSDFESSAFNGNITEIIIENALMVSSFNTTDDLGVVGVLYFNNVVRGDTSSYRCIASNQLPQTTLITTPSSVVDLTVLERPDAPVNVHLLNPGPRSVNIQWMPTFNGNREVQRFIVYRMDVNTSSEFVEVANFAVSALEAPVNNFYTANITEVNLILPFTVYSAVVVACNEIGCSSQSNESNQLQTNQDLSTPPRSFIIITADTSNITMEWIIPDPTHGIISQYRLSFRGSKSYDSGFSDEGVSVFNSSNAMVTNDTWRAVLQGLFAGTEYQVTVAAVNGAARNNGIGMSSAEKTATTLSLPPPSPPNPVMLDSFVSPIPPPPRTYIIPLVPFSEINGLISHYHVIVVIIPTGQSVNDLRPPNDYKTLADFNEYSEDFCKQEQTAPKAYIAAEYGRSQIPPNMYFIVGNDDSNNPNSPNDNNQYTNGPLCYSTSYTFFFRAYTAIDTSSVSRRSVRQTNNRQYTMFTSSSYFQAVTTEPRPAGFPGVAVGVVIAVILAIVVAVAVVIISIVVVRRRSDAYKPDTYYTNTGLQGSGEEVQLVDYVPPQEGSDVRQPVPLSALATHVERMHYNENCGFGEEYRIIQDKAPKKPVDACTLPDNKPRNRYANIQCFDETRVVLKPLDGYEHDYINASFIIGYNREQEYIAAQGPLPDTVVDFWRMIWEYDVPTIVMLTNLQEKMKVKCSQYWPNKEPANYGPYTVTLVNTVTLADFITRHFQVTNILTDETKDVRQFHFISWPDFGVPRHATPLLYFLRRIRNSHKYNNQKPLIIHCSAGVGRTGTLITIDTQLQKAEKEKCVDPFNYVNQLREQRNHMVQTEAQYIFLHDAILEGALSGKTEVPVEKLGSHMKKLEALDEEEESGYKKEFQMLRQFKVNVREFTDANDDNNKFKNRVTNALPYNYNRVHLQMKPGIGGSDYINASFIDGYAKRCTYIATQGPLKNTVDDFWRMVWERSVSVVVMLTQLGEKGKELCVQYWPNSKNSPEKLEDFTVELLEEGSFEDYITRDIKLTQVETGNVRTVRHFHFTAWPEYGAPVSGVGMVDLIDQVNRKQQQTGDKPIVVHCSAGIGSTGAFCALSTAIERVKAEGLVDVFHTVKHLRTQRPHMVQSVEQYAFCYRAIHEYVESLNSYSNFV